MKIAFKVQKYNLKESLKKKFVYEKNVRTFLFPSARKKNGKICRWTQRGPDPVENTEHGTTCTGIGAFPDIDAWPGLESARRSCPHDDYATSLLNEIYFLRKHKFLKIRHPMRVKINSIDFVINMSQTT
jgi:hypothetical protein